MTEEWRPCPDFDGVYEVSDLGCVRRILAHNGTRIERLCAITTSYWPGYPTVQLWKGNHHVTKYVHELVARAFIGPKPTDYVQNHKDGIKTNNRVENLEWVSYGENNHHAYITNLRITPSKVQLICAGCDQGFTLSRWRFHERQKTGQPNFYCSLLCYHSAPLKPGHRERISEGLRKAYAEGRR